MSADPRAPSRARRSRHLTLRALAPSAHARAARRRPTQSAQALVELAIVLPVLLLLLLAAIDLGRIFYARITVENAAREGAVEAANNPSSYSAGSACSTTNRVTCAAVNEAADGAFVAIAPADVSRSCSPDCSETYGNRVTVTVTGHFRLLTPVMWAFTGGPNVTLTSTAIADIVRIPPPTGSTPAPTASPTPTPAPTPTPDPSGTPGPTPTATASPSPSPTCAPPAVTSTGYSQHNRNRPVAFTSAVTPSSGACAVISWRWDFGDGEVGVTNVSTAEHDYPARGASYTVTLTVTGPHGVSAPYVFVITTLP